MTEPLSESEVRGAEAAIRDAPAFTKHTSHCGYSDDYSGCVPECHLRALHRLIATIDQLREALDEARDALAAGGPTDMEARALFIEEHNRLEALEDRLREQDELVEAHHSANERIVALRAERDQLREALERIADPFTGHAPGSLEPGEHNIRDIARIALHLAEKVPE